MSVITNVRSLVDYKPLIQRNSTNVLTAVEAVRDQIHRYFVEACLEEGIEALVLKSPPYNALVWVSFECWVHSPETESLTDRSFATVNIRPKEFYRYEYEIDLEIRDGEKIKGRQIWHYPSVIHFGPEHARQVVRHLIRRARMKKFQFRQCRVASWEFWRPKNTITRLRPDWARIGVVTLVLLSLAAIVADLVIPGGMSIPLLVGSAFTYLVSLAALIMLNRRDVYVLTSGRPAQEPRNMIRLDSWQALVYDLGKECESIKAGVQSELERARHEGFQIAIERIWHRDTQGAEEREQLVVTFRRGIGFIQIYSYGDDLYVGWDAHINCGTWTEARVATGIDLQTGRPCHANTITAGWHTPNEYDITDTNCLIEWMHGAITKVIKRMMAVHKIDQEIDFHIHREDRRDISGRGEEQGEGEKKRKGFHFKREA